MASQAPVGHRVLAADAVAVTSADLQGSAAPYVAGAEGAGSLPAILRRDALLRRWLAFADVVSCGLALVVATKVLADDDWRATMLLILLLVVPIAKLVGLYDRDERLLRKSTLDEAVAVLRLVTVYTLLVWLLAPALVFDTFRRWQVVGLWGLLLVLIVAARLITRIVVLSSCPCERCLLVGKQATCERIAGKLDGSRGISARVIVGLPFESPTDEAAEMHSLAREGRLAQLVSLHDIHRLIIAPHDSDAEHILDLVQEANALGLHISIVPRMLEVVGNSVEFDDLNGLTVLGVKPFGLGRSSRLIKRSLDLAGSLVGLVLLSPLYAAIALAIKLDSAGPALFAQHRVGQDGRSFTVLKFRTMIDGADAMRESLAPHNEADGLFKIAEDPRMTRIGRVLRRFSLDELPQLINVLRGEMSLVGPRPLVIDEDERIEGWYRQRLTLTPGMTGRWQILGSARIPLSEMVKLDYLYVANWSLWNDVKILLRTVPYVLERRGM